MENKKLTKKQEKVFEIISGHFEKNGHSPTIAELCRLMGVRSSRTVTQYLDVLERKGAIQRDRYEKRGIVPLIKKDAANSNTEKIPVICSADCQNPNFLTGRNYEDHILVSKEFLKNKNNNLLAIRASDNSMSEAKISSGDIFLLEQTEKIENGDSVLAIIDNAPVVKKIILAENSIILNSESKDMGYKPIVLPKDFKVLGKIFDVIKCDVILPPPPVAPPPPAPIKFTNA